MNSYDVTEYLKQYNGEWLHKFLFAVFGKYHYVHTLSGYGLDCYLSNLRSVSEPSPHDNDCVRFYITVGQQNGEYVNLYTMVDFKEPNVFINTFEKYLKLKAFI